MSRNIVRGLSGTLRAVLTVFLLTVGALTMRTSTCHALVTPFSTFTITAVPYVGIYPGNTWAEQVHVRSTRNGAEITNGIGLRLTGLPAGVTYSLGTPNVFYYPVFLSVAPWTPPGYYTITVTGYYLPPLIDPEQHSTTFTLQVL